MPHQGGLREDGRTACLNGVLVCSLQQGVRNPHTAGRKKGRKERRKRGAGAKGFEKRLLTQQDREQVAEVLGYALELLPEHDQQHHHHGEVDEAQRVGSLAAGVRPPFCAFVRRAS